jgi:hypothetical protein
VGTNGHWSMFKCPPPQVWAAKITIARSPLHDLPPICDLLSHPLGLMPLKENRSLTPTKSDTNIMVVPGRGPHELR